MSTTSTDVDDTARVNSTVVAIEEQTVACLGLLDVLAAIFYVPIKWTLLVQHAPAGRKQEGSQKERDK